MTMPVAAGLYYFSHENESIHSPPVLLIHGAGGSHLSWPAEIRRLVGHSVYAIDLPGHGKSDAHGEQSISAYADHVLTWMQAVNLYRAFIVGHSMGGAIAMVIGATAPVRVAGLGLIGIGTPFEIPRDIIENLSNPAMVSTALNQIKSLSFGPATHPRLVELISKRLREMRASVLRGDFLACAEFNITNALEGIEQPTLVIAGAQDQMTPLRYVQLLTKKIEGAELNVIPDAGHMLMLEKPNDVAERLSTFLQKHQFFL
jgi:pimeloyl-ACP methyl ester carboxylesterase